MKISLKKKRLWVEDPITNVKKRDINSRCKLGYLTDLVEIAAFYNSDFANGKRNHS